MAILAIDTCVEQCAVALLLGHGDSFELVEPRSKGHAERLPLMVAEALAKTGTTPKNISKIAVSTGPGSFTGVRVGLAFARGFALGHAMPIVGMTSLEALAISLIKGDIGSNSHTGLVASIIDARRGQVYAQLFDPQQEGENIHLNPITDAIIADPPQAGEQLTKLIASRRVNFVGSGVKLCFPAEKPLFDYPNPISMALYAQNYAGADHPSPSYLRAPDAKPARLFTVKN